MQRTSKIDIGIALVLLAPCAVMLLKAYAGSFDPPAGPGDAGSAMYTLEDIYNRLTGNTKARKRSGGFAEPSKAPGAGGHTLDQVYEEAIPTQVPRTGQTTSDTAGDDGDLRKGVPWPAPRFTNNNDGTVTDNLTGLVWLAKANCLSGTWLDCFSFCNGLGSGQCGLSDGSTAGKWRMPNLFEMESLRDMAYKDPALSNAAGTGQWSAGDPFTDVQNNYYWTSTNYSNVLTYKWAVYMSEGSTNDYVYNADVLYVLPVRSYRYGVDVSFVWPVRDAQSQPSQRADASWYAATGNKM